MAVNPNIEISIHRIQRFGRNGDRATVDTPYYDYKVVLTRPGLREPFTLREWLGYDNFNSHIVPDQKNEAGAYVAALQIKFGFPNVRNREFVTKRKTVEEVVEVNP